MDLSTADPFGLQIGHFYDRHPQGRWFKALGSFAYPSADTSPGDESNPIGLLSRRDAALAVAQWTHGATIVGMCPNFDTECLSWMLAEHGLTPGWHYSLVDVETFAAGYLRHIELDNMAKARELNPDIKFTESVAALPFDSTRVTKAMGVELPTDAERHTAMGDTRWCLRLYDAVMAES
jgi:hypothetical protein